MSCGHLIRKYEIQTFKYICVGYKINVNYFKKKEKPFHQMAVRQKDEFRPLSYISFTSYKN